MKYRIAFYTLGCKLNFSETSHISREFDNDNFEVVNFKDIADIYVINSCAVTSVAEKKSKNAITGAKKRNPNSKICVVGCFSELNIEKLKEDDNIDIVLGSSDKFLLPKKIKEYFNIEKKNFRSEDNNFYSSWSEGDRTRTFLKIQDGCDYHCSYCTVCIARGISRSDKISNVIKNASIIADKGIKEIILTGVNIGDFGKNTNETLFDLLCELETIDKLERIRISSIEPNLLTNDIIHLVSKSEKIMPHFHIPLQSGNNKILSLMKRRYKRELFEEKVNLINSLISNCYIAADVIVGFPTESEEDFYDTYNFIKSLPISDLHIFSYSKRSNTIASEMKEQIKEQVKQERSKILRGLRTELKNNFYKKNITNELKVLFESKNDKGTISGFAENYLKCTTNYEKNLINKIVKVKICNFVENYETYIVEPLI